MIKITQFKEKCNVLSCHVEMEGGYYGNFELELLINDNYKILSSTCPDNHKMYERQARFAIMNQYPEMDVPDTIVSAWF